MSKKTRQDTPSAIVDPYDRAVLTRTLGKVRAASGLDYSVNREWLESFLARVLRTSPGPVAELAPERAEGTGQY